MNIKDSAQLTSNEATHQYIISDVAQAIISKDAAATEKVAEFETNRLAAINSGAAAGINNSGFSQDKLDAKEEMGFMAACLGGNAQVKLDELGKNAISKQINSNESYYDHLTDSEASTEAQALHDLLEVNIAFLTPNYVTLPELVSFQSLIANYLTIQGSSEAVHKISPELTLAFANDLKASRKSGLDLLKLLKKYKKTNKVFYKSMGDVLKLKITVHHTDVDVLVLDAVTGHPVQGAIATFSDSNKTGISLDDGSLLVEEISHGVKTMTIKSDKHLVSITTINIASGRTNSFKIELLPKG